MDFIVKREKKLTDIFKDLLIDISCLIQIKSFLKTVFERI